MKIKEAYTFDYQFSLVDFVWSQKTYESFAKKVMALLGLKPSTPSPVPETFLDNIAKADFKYLILENERISKALSEKPLDASLHEQAALLIGVFASLEGSGSFTDCRELLSRMCAHLTLAKIGNNDKKTFIGEIANSLLESWSVRKKIAFDSIQKLNKQAQRPVEKSLLRAVRMLIDHDFRVYDEDNATEFENLVFCRFYASARSSDKAIERLKHHLSPLRQPWRRMLSVGMLSVSSRGLVSTEAVSSALAEFVETRNAYKHVNESAVSTLCDELNLQPSGCLAGKGESPALNVLSWSHIAALHQRQLSFAIILEYNFLRWTMASYERAAELKANSLKTFGNLNLFPLVAERFSLNNEEKKNNYAAIEKVLNFHPEIVTSQVWKEVIRVASQTGSTVSPGVEAWFDPAMPLGTVFIERLNQQNCSKSLAFVEELRRLNPYNGGIALQWLQKKFGDYPTAQQYRDAFGAMADYDLQAMKFVCKGEIRNPAKLIPLAEKIAQEEPAVFLDLADYCAINQMPEKAVDYYEKAFKLSPNSITNANNCDWLVQHYYEIGEKKKAEDLAKSAADVYSHRGLQTLARLYERQGELSKAEDLYKQIAVRYKSITNGLSFCLRNKEKSESYRKSADELLPRIFPKGLEKISLTSCKGEPEKGVFVQSYRWFSDSPLKLNTVIVGMDGYKIESLKQYQVIKDLRDKKTCAIIFWDGKEYKEISEPTLHSNYLLFSVASYTKLGSK